MLPIESATREFIDCLTFSDILPENLIIVCEAQTPYYYDIESLARYFQVSKRMENPFSKVPLNVDIRIQILKYLQKDIIALIINFQITVYLPNYTLIGVALIHIVVRYKSLESCIGTQVICNSKSLYAYNLTDPIQVLGTTRRFNCIISHPTTPENLRKLKRFLEDFPIPKYSELLKSLIDNELEFGTRRKIPK